MSEPRITVDDKLWPLVQQAMHPGYGDADVDRMMRTFDGFFMRGSRYVLLVWTEPGAPLLNVRQRQKLGRWSREHAEIIRRANIGTAVVLDSALLRATMTAINWVTEPVTPQHAVATRLEGVECCVRMLEAAGVEVTPAIRALRDDLAKKRVPTFGR